MEKNAFSGRVKSFQGMVCAHGFGFVSLAPFRGNANGGFAGEGGSAGALSSSFVPSRKSFGPIRKSPGPIRRRGVPWDK